MYYKIHNKTMIKSGILFFLSFSSFSCKKVKVSICEVSNSLHPSKLVPKSPLQKTYLSHLNDPECSIVLGLGPAGTGKTLFACHSAIQQLHSKKINKIVITRPSICVDEDIGFLPGNVLKKMDPFTRPLFDIFSEYYTNPEINNFIQNNIIEISTLGFMRGRTFKNSFIIADEMQNATPAQVKMLMTRIGTNSKIVITGDVEQADRHSGDNGLLDLCAKLATPVSGIAVCEMQTRDVQRHSIIGSVLKLYAV